MNNDRRILVGTVGLLALSACATDGQQSIASTSFGEANRQTMMAQVIDPDPQYTQPAQGSGEQAAAAVERYRKGAVKKPDRIHTTNIGGAGGGSSSGSGSN